MLYAYTFFAIWPFTTILHADELIQFCYTELACLPSPDFSYRELERSVATHFNSCTSEQGLFDTFGYLAHH